MKNQKYCVFLFAQLISLSCFAMEIEKTKEEKTIKSKEGVSEQQRDIFFRTVATYTIGLKNTHDWIIKRHPLFEYDDDGRVPYKNGNGGLLNPILHKFDISKQETVTENYRENKITINGHVSAEGIANYLFDKTYWGKSNNPEVSKYEISLLEETLLGFLKEDEIDKNMSDSTKTFLGHGEFAKNFIECLKHEWTSTQNEQDTGIRTPEETELIQRHMMRSTYWSSRWGNPQNMRRGEYIRREFLDGKNDKFASVELNEFDVQMKIPGKPE